nr:unnamed protein product [Spirometra erinaceieuropaei]
MLLCAFLLRHSLSLLSTLTYYLISRSEVLRQKRQQSGRRPRPLVTLSLKLVSHSGERYPSDNPRRNLPERRTVLVARELARHKVDIAALCETRFSKQGQLEEVGGGYTVLWGSSPKAE